MRTREVITAEIRQRLGFVPPFFFPALEEPRTLDSLWQQTRASYLESTLPGPFKERVFAQASRACGVPYGAVCHPCDLNPQGMTTERLLALLEPDAAGPTGTG